MDALNVTLMLRDPAKIKKARAQFGLDHARRDSPDHAAGYDPEVGAR